MRHHALLLGAILTCTSVFAANDPFVGIWGYNAQKTPKPTIRYAIKDLGGDRYALTGSTGVTVAIKADGVSIKTSTGATVSFKRLDHYHWEMDRDDGEKMVRIFTISTDDKTLTLHDVFTDDAGKDSETITKYARLSPGKNILGEWQSVSIEEDTFGKVPKLIITPFQTDGLSFSLPAHKHLSEMKFDGKLYADRGAADLQGHSSSGRRVNGHVLQIEDYVNEKTEFREEWKVSDDGKTLTIVSRPAYSSAVFTEVWDRQER